MSNDYFSIEMEHSVELKGVPEVLGEKHIKPELKKKVSFKKGTLSDLFDHDYLSLLAVNVIEKFPITTKVEYAAFRYQSQRWCIVKVDGYQWTSVNQKVYKEKI